MVRGAGGGDEAINFGGQEVKGQGHSHDADVRFGDLAEAWFWTRSVE